ncbi:uncharacterized protein [Montipora capricornis]|uniref:uncharacterized protein isoform X2 n=1 Tax=Montipora capricornis TaxID=246305 RepID=UPI0035F189B5
MSVDYNGYVIFHERQGNTTGANSLAPKTTLYSSRAASINHLPGSTDQISWRRRPKPAECRFNFKYLCAWIQTSLESLLGTLRPGFQDKLLPEFIFKKNYRNDALYTETIFALYSFDFNRFFDHNECLSE